MSDSHNDTGPSTFNEQPSLALQICKRLNNSWEAITEGQQLQDRRPWQPIRSNTGSVFVGMVSSPRDLEITAAILETIERGEYTSFAPQQTTGQTQLPL